MDERQIQAKLVELQREISVPPATERAKLQAAASTGGTHRQLAATANSLQESMDSLRMSIKYLVFDLEATKRENASLRLLLEVASDEELGTPDELR